MPLEFELKTPLTNVRIWKFLLNGMVMGILCISIRRLVGDALPADSSSYYAISVAVAYTTCIFMSFVIQQNWVFSSVAPSQGLQRFVLINIAAALFTSVLAIPLRRMMEAILIPQVSYEMCRIAGLVTAAALVSFFNYWAIGRFVFVTHPAR